MNKKLTLSVVAGAFSLVNVGDSIGQAAQRPCVDNYGVEGTFWTATRTFRSHQEHRGLDKAKAFERIAQQVAADGWQGMNAQKDVGVITAVQSVTHGKGKQAALNVVLKPEGEALRVEAVFTTTRGLKVEEKHIQDALQRSEGSSLEDRPPALPGSSTVTRTCRRALPHFAFAG